MKWRLAAALAASVTVVAGLAVATSGGTAALAGQRPDAGPTLPGGTWGVPQVIGVPAGGAPYSGAIRSMSCTARGDCTAVGFYSTTSGAVAQIVTETNGVWGNPVPLPGYAALNVGGGILSFVISCSDPRDCAVGGEYTGQVPPGGLQPVGAFTATEIDGTWGNAQAVDISELTGASEYATLYSISCTSPGNCAAAGQYGIPGNPLQAFLVTETGGTWGPAQQVPGLSSLSTAGTVYADIMQVSCGSDGNCTAAGYADGQQTLATPIIVNEVAGSWANAQRVSGVASGIAARIDTVSCSGTGDCTAVGGYLNDPDKGLFAATETGGSWSAATSIPEGIQDNGVVVSCAAPGDCTLAGSSAGVFAVTQTNGRWGTVTGIPGAPGGSAAITSVSCAAPGTCSAAGDFHGDLDTAFVANETHGVWGSAKNVARSSGTDIDAISCGGPGYCSVAVSKLHYVGKVVASQELIVNEATASAPVVRPVPAKVTYGHETFRVSVRVTSPDGGTPTGSVTVAAGSHVLCAATLVSGAASCLIAKAGFQAGTSHLVATYGGDAAYVSSTSPPAALTIVKAATKTALTLARTEIVYGHENVEQLSVTVSGQYGATPAGKVAVRAGRTLIAVITLVAGQGSYTLTARQLKAGTYRLTAAYSGSADLARSDSAPKTLKVAK